VRDLNNRSLQDGITEQDANSVSPPQTAGVSAEQHYSVSDVASRWGLGKDVVRRIFQNEPGVLVLGGRASGRKRRYTTLRIPQSVLERVHRKYAVGN
jgi:hypothetical protein